MKKKFLDAFVKTIAVLSGGNIRGQYNSIYAPDLRWWWTPWTYHSKHGGWIYLNRKWLKEYWKSDPGRVSDGYKV